MDTDKNKESYVNVPEKHLPTKPLTRQELHDDAHERISLIKEEFKRAFSFLRDYPKSVTFFGGSHFKENEPYYEKAVSLSSRVAKELNYSVFTGGGPGIMEAANKGAFEAGGQSIGLTIELAHHQIQNKYLTKNLDFYYFFSRKVGLSFSAEAYVFFPGGFGTLDEFYEIITLVQTKKIEKVPVILFGKEFWQPLEDFMKKQMLEMGSIDPDDLALYTITDDEDEVLDIIKNAPIRNGIKFTHHKEEEKEVVLES
jgi:uncharacterized protein (TIGR00730 family)